MSPAKTVRASGVTGITDVLFPFVRADANDGVIIDIHVVPNARKTQVDGLQTSDARNGHIALKLRLKAPPVDGKANDALLRWLASQLGIGRNTLKLVRGQTSRRKQFGLSIETTAGADWQKLIAPLQRNQTEAKQLI
ncbi:MAG: DUF167 domain-containing protein [Pseudomonadota bacterium]